MGVSDSVLAAMIGASATLVTALFNLVSALRKPSSNTGSSSVDRRKPASNLRSMLWIVAMMLAAGVGGFAYAEMRSQQARDEVRLLRLDLQQQMQALTASTARLEQLRLAPPSGASPNAIATVTLPACRGSQVGFASQRAPCTEQEALQVSVCAPVPASAQVSGIDLYSRFDDGQTPWSQARVAPGQDNAGGRFADASFERPDGDNMKLVCQNFSHWNSEKGRTVRVVVRIAG